MQERVLSRIGAACGALYVVLILVGNSLDESGNGAVGGPMLLVGMTLFVPFAGYLFGVLRRAEGNDGWLSATALGAGLAGITIKLASAAPEIAAGELAQGTPLYRAFELMNGASFNLSMFPFAVMAAAVAILTLRTRVLPAWIGWMGAVTAPAMLVNAMFFFAEFILAFVLFLLWVMLLSAVLTLRAGRASAPTTATPEPARVVR